MWWLQSPINSRYILGFGKEGQYLVINLSRLRFLDSINSTKAEFIWEKSQIRVQRDSWLESIMKMLEFELMLIKGLNVVAVGRWRGLVSFENLSLQRVNKLRLKQGLPSRQFPCRWQEVLKFFLTWIAPKTV